MAAKKSNYEESYIKPSRSAKKRECLALQKLGEELAALGADERAQLNLPEELLAALNEYDLLKDKEARRRQRQFIGRLMRETRPEEIEGALEKRRNIRLSQSASSHRAEKWRNRLLNASSEDLAALVGELVGNIGINNIKEAQDALMESALKARDENNRGVNHGASRQLFREIASIFRKEKKLILMPVKRN